MVADVKETLFKGVATNNSKLTVPKDNLDPHRVYDIGVRVNDMYGNTFEEYVRYSTSEALLI